MSFPINVSPKDAIVPPTAVVTRPAPLAIRTPFTAPLTAAPAISLADFPWYAAIPAFISPPAKAPTAIQATLPFGSTNLTGLLCV